MTIQIKDEQIFKTIVYMFLKEMNEYEANTPEQVTTLQRICEEINNIRDQI